MVTSPLVEDDAPPDAAFSVRDYEGVEIVCTRQQWDSKIARDHPELRDRQREVIAAIEQPGMVLQDRDYPDRKHHMVRMPAGHWLKVVVDYEPDPPSGREHGSVRTAFLHRRRRAGDTVLYIQNED